MTVTANTPEMPAAATGTSSKHESIDAAVRAALRSSSPSEPYLKQFQNSPFDAPFVVAHFTSSPTPVPLPNKMATKTRVVSTKLIICGRCQQRSMKYWKLRTCVADPHPQGQSDPRELSSNPASDPAFEPASVPASAPASVPGSESLA